MAIDGKIQGRALKKWVSAHWEERPNHKMPEGWVDYQRTRVPSTPVDRRTGVSQIELGYDTDEAAIQGMRCVECSVNTVFDGSKCINCNGCVDVCPWDCLKIVSAKELTGDEKTLEVLRAHGADREGVTAMIKDDTICTRCARCAERCPTGAITMEDVPFPRNVDLRDLGASHRRTHGLPTPHTSAADLEVGLPPPVVVRPAGPLAGDDHQPLPSPPPGEGLQAEPALQLHDGVGGGCRWWSFLILVGTGVLLMFHYCPSVERAYTDVVEIQTVVPFGQLLRNLHRWAAHLMVLVTVLHMIRVFYTGAYKPPREFNWVIGCVLLLLTLLASFTGYLLPWDQLAFWAITVGTSVAEYEPMMGSTIAKTLLGGVEVGQESLIRFYTLHIAVIPLAISALIALHMWRGAQRRRPCRDRGATRQVRQDTRPDNNNNNATQCLDAEEINHKDTKEEIDRIKKKGEH